jgi:hypothetical protein
MKTQNVPPRIIFLIPTIPAKADKNASDAFEKLEDQKDYPEMDQFHRIKNIDQLC